MDADDDGLGDRAEDADQDGHHGARESHPLLHDSDGDGLLDGTEKGRDTSSLSGHLAWATDTSKHAPRWTSTPTWAGGPTMYTFVPDADTSNNTRAWSTDSDLDGLADNDEDINRNGAHDSDADQSACTWTATLSEQSTIFAGTDPGLYWEAPTTCELGAHLADSDADLGLDGDEIAGWTVRVIDVRIDSGSDNLVAQDTTLYTSSPWDNDSDDDGLMDGEERNVRSNPQHNDTDGDTFLDGEDDNPVIIENTLPSVVLDRAHFWRAISLAYDGTTIHLVRAFRLSLTADDSAGLSRVMLWLLPADTDPVGIHTAQGGINILALAALKAKQGPFTHTQLAGLIATTISTVDADLGSERGLRTSVSWEGVLQSRVPITSETLRGALTAVIADLPDFVTGAFAKKLVQYAQAVLGSADLYQQFGSWSLHLAVSDTNGNSGHGVLRYDRLPPSTALGSILLPLVSRATDAMRDSTSSWQQSVVDSITVVLRDSLTSLAVRALSLPGPDTILWTRELAASLVWIYDPQLTDGRHSLEASSTLVRILDLQANLVSLTGQFSMRSAVDGAIADWIESVLLDFHATLPEMMQTLSELVRTVLENRQLMSMVETAIEVGLSAGSVLAQPSLWLISLVDTLLDLGAVITVVTLAVRDKLADFPLADIGAAAIPAGFTAQDLIGWYHALPIPSEWPDLAARQLSLTTVRGVRLAASFGTDPLAPYSPYSVCPPLPRAGLHDEDCLVTDSKLAANFLFWSAAIGGGLAGIHPLLAILSILPLSVQISLLNNLGTDPRLDNNLNYSHGFATQQEAEADLQVQLDNWNTNSVETTIILEFAGAAVLIAGIFFGGVSLAVGAITGTLGLIMTMVVQFGNIPLENQMLAVVLELIASWFASFALVRAVRDAAVAIWSLAAFPEPVTGIPRGWVAIWSVLHALVNFGVAWLAHDQLAAHLDFKMAYDYIQANLPET